MEILKQQILQFTEELSMFSRVDSPASHIVQQENEKENQIIEISGRKCLEQFMKFNQPGLWAKTFAELLIGMGEWHSIKYNLIWKLRATKYSRFYFQLAALALHTSEKESGLSRINQIKSLSHIFPTPTAMEYKDVGYPKTLSKIDKGGRIARRICSIRKDLPQDIRLKVNPSLLEQMMGFPIGWTVLNH